MRLTPRGYGAIGITIISLAATVVLGEESLWPLAAVGVSCLCCSVLAMLVFGKKANHHVWFPVDRAHRNEEVSLHWEVQRTGVLSRLVRLRTAQGGSAELRVHGMKREHSHVTTWRNVRRGVIAVSGIDETIRDPLHLVRRSRRYDKQASMTIWPARWELSRALLKTAWENPAYESTEHGQDAGVRSLRHYAAGDDPRHVHWAASAHHGELIVAERTKDGDPRVLVMLDTQVTPAMLDMATDAACSLVWMLSKEGAEWSLAAGHVVVESSKGQAIGDLGADLDAAFDALAVVRTGEMQVQEMLDASQRAMRVVVTSRSLSAEPLDGADVVVWLHAGDTSGTPDADSRLVVTWDVRLSFQDAWEGAFLN